MKPKKEKKVSQKKPVCPWHKIVLLGTPINECIVEWKCPMHGCPQSIIQE